MMRTVCCHSARLALAGVLTLCGASTVATAQNAARYLELGCEADQSTWPSVPDGVYRPRSVTFRFDTIARSVQMEEAGTLLASSPGVVFSERAIKWGSGKYGLATWERLGAPEYSAFDGTLDRMLSDAVVSWQTGTGGSTRVRVFRGRCRPLTKQIF